MTGPTKVKQANVFEWCWEHSRAEGDARQILLALAFKTDDDTRVRSSIPALAAPLGLSRSAVLSAISALIELGELAIYNEGRHPSDYPAPVYTFPAYETARLPHSLILSTWDGEPYDGEDVHRWDHAEIECPHQPATETMPCALWEPCGCPGDLAEMSGYVGGSGDGVGPCARSATGTHRYREHEPNRPVASCWALDWEAEIAERAFELGLMPGTHLVRPWWDGDAVQLELVEPQAVAR